MSSYDDWKGTAPEDDRPDICPNCFCTLKKCQCRLADEWRDDE